VVGNPEIRVTFKRAASPHVRVFFERQLEKIVGCNGCGDCISLCAEESLVVSEGGRLMVGESSCTSCLECIAGPCELLNIGILQPA
jgi:ferredoxin